MARLVELQTSLGNTSDHVRSVFEELAARFEIHFAWGWGATGDHSRGRALDVMSYSLGGGVDAPGPIRAGWNLRVKDYVLANRDRLCVKYVIYDQTIVSRSPESVTGVPPWTPKPYKGVSHANHVHTSFTDDVSYTPPGEDEEDMPTAQEIARATVAEMREVFGGDAVTSKGQVRIGNEFEGKVFQEIGRGRSAQNQILAAQNTLLAAITKLAESQDVTLDFDADDAQAVAAALAPYVIAALPHWSTEQVQAFATAGADEIARRLAPPTT